MKTFQVNGATLQLIETNYAAGPLAVHAIDQNGEPWATLSVYLPNSKNLPDGHFYLKDWSENAPVAKAALDAGVIEYANPFLYPPMSTGFIGTVKVVRIVR